MWGEVALTLVARHSFAIEWNLSNAVNVSTYYEPISTRYIVTDGFDFGILFVDYQSLIVPYC